MAKFLNLLALCLCTAALADGATEAKKLSSVSVTVDIFFRDETTTSFGPHQQEAVKKAVAETLGLGSWRDVNMTSIIDWQENTIGFPSAYSSILKVAMSISASAFTEQQAADLAGVMLQDSFATQLAQNAGAQWMLARNTTLANRIMVDTSTISLSGIQKSTEYGVGLFYEMQCLEAQNPAYHYQVHRYVNLFLDSYRYEGMASMYLYAMLTLLFNFASPSPDASKPFGQVVASVWTMCLAAQIVSTIMGTVMLALATASFALLYKTCARELVGGYTLLNMLFTLTSWSHPAILAMANGVIAAYKLMLTATWLETTKRGRDYAHKLRAKRAVERGKEYNKADYKKRERSASSAFNCKNECKCNSTAIVRWWGSVVFKIETALGFLQHSVFRVLGTIFVQSFWLWIVIGYIVFYVPVFSFTAFAFFLPISLAETVLFLLIAGVMWGFGACGRALESGAREGDNACSPCAFIFGKIGECTTHVLLL